MDVANHVVHEYVTRGLVTFFFVSCVDIPADMLTKPLPSPAFIFFRRVMGVGADLGNAGLGATPAPRPASTSSAAVPTCIWMSFCASHRIWSAVHDIGTAPDVLQEILVCILSSFSSPYMSFLCCNVLGRDRSILKLRA